jgi:ankyrin repeat protein
MRSRIVVTLVLALLAAASAYSQTLVDLAAYGTLPDVQAAIDKGADVNASKTGRTPLIVAAASNAHPEVLAALIKAGADLDARDAEAGGSPLMWASINENPEMAATLLKSGADPNARDKDGATALIWAAVNSQNPDVIIVLLNSGADARARDNAGKTALSYARNRSILEGTDALKKLEAASR